MQKQRNDMTIGDLFQEETEDSVALCDIRNGIYSNKGKLLDILSPKHGCKVLMPTGKYYHNEGSRVYKVNFSVNAQAAINLLRSAIGDDLPKELEEKRKEFGQSCINFAKLIAKDTAAFLGADGAAFGIMLAICKIHSLIKNSSFSLMTCGIISAVISTVLSLIATKLSYDCEFFSFKKDLQKGFQSFEDNHFHYKRCEKDITYAKQLVGLLEERLDNLCGPEPEVPKQETQIIPEAQEEKTAEQNAEQDSDEPSEFTIGGRFKII
jgi:hypothetical protein